MDNILPSIGLIIILLLVIESQIKIALFVAQINPIYTKNVTPLENRTFGFCCDLVLVCIGMCRSGSMFDSSTTRMFILIFFRSVYPFTYYYISSLDYTVDIVDVRQTN